MHSRITMLGLAVLALAFPLEGAVGADDDGKGASQAGVAAAAPIYQLPKVGKPRKRVGGGRRGTSAAMPEVVALVPNHVGLTVSEQPTLYWYLSTPVEEDLHFELTLIDQESIDPLVDSRVEAPLQPGLHGIRLADYGIKLAPGQEYQWAVSLVADAARHSEDRVSSGWVERVAEPDDLAKSLADAGPEGATSVYGNAGLWYDALGAACELSASNPDETRYRSQLATLLQQVDLPVPPDAVVVR